METGSKQHRRRSLQSSEAPIPPCATLALLLLIYLCASLMDETFKTLAARLTRSISDLDSNETQARSPRTWSIQQIVEHLMLTYSSTEALIADRIAKGRPTQASLSLLQRCGQVYVIRLGLFPGGVQAPAAVTPSTDPIPLSGEQLAWTTTEQLCTLDAMLGKAASMFGERNRFASHVILGPLTPRQWRLFHLAHGLHHINQIHSLRRRLSVKSHRQSADPDHRR